MKPQTELSKYGLQTILLLLSAEQIVFTVAAPSQVTNVALSKTLDRGRPGLTVTWAAPQGDKTISQYYVQYKRNEFAFWGSQTVIGGSPPPTCTLLARLAAGTLYDVRVKAVSAAGHGPWSAVQTERTYFDAPPNIPTPPSELDIANIPVCCAGVQLDVDYLDDSAIHVQASIDGTPHPANQVVIDGNSLYIMGLQAGTEHSLNITLSNTFGSAWTNTRVMPLLGRPSTPTVTLTPTSSSLTIQLTTVYPGTREESLQYSISLTASPHSRWQVEQQTIPVTNLTTPVNGSTEVALSPGNYSVTVTVTNQHGSTMSEPQAVTVPVYMCYLPSTELLPVVIALSAALLSVVILLAVATFIAIWIFQRSRKSAISSFTKHHTTATNEARYEDQESLSNGE